MGMRASRGIGWIAGAAVLALALTGCGTSRKAEPPAGTWLTSLDEGLADAQAHKRPILLDFYTDW